MPGPSFLGLPAANKTVSGHAGDTTYSTVRSRRRRNLSLHANHSGVNAFVHGSWCVVRAEGRGSRG